MKKNGLKSRIEEWAMPEPNSGCWIWFGAVDRHGYGQIRGDAPQSKMLKAHRASYEESRGKIPVGLVIDHKCGNKSCVNPDHLEPVTPAENTRRWAALKTHCVKGHLLTPENTMLSGGYRSCRICKRAHYKRWVQSGGAHHRQRMYGTAPARDV